MAEICARLDHAGLAVADLEACAAWFCDVFGLVPELTLRVDTIDLSIEMLIHPVFGYRLELLHRPGTGAGGTGTAAGKPANPAEAALRAGYGHVAFDVTDLDGAFDRAVDRGARPVMPPCPSPEPGVRMAFVADPEGNLIELLHREHTAVNKELPMNRIIFTGGQVFDGTGAPPVPGDVVVRGDRVESVRPGGGTVGNAGAEPGDQVVDCAGATVMPGLIESHAHLTFPSAIGHIDPSFNPPLDVSFFRHMPTPDEHLAIARRNAKILLDHGFTSAYSAGSLTPVPTEVRLRGEIAAGATPGPRMRAASFERDNNPVQMGPDGPKPKKTGPDGVREFIAEQAAIGFDAVKLLMSNDDVFTEGGSMVTQYNQEEAAAAGEQARESGVWLNCHAQSPESIKLAVRNGFRSVYHCTYADAEAIDLLEEHKDEIFLSPAVGIMWANVYEGAEYGIDTAMAEKMGSVKALRAMTELYPELRKRGLRVLPGGDYGFPNNPIGRNARDLELFVRLFGYSPAEVLRAATQSGGELMDMPTGRLAPDYLADVLVVRGEPAADVSVLQDPGNLLAIMQGGAFWKLAPQLTAA